MAKKAKPSKKIDSQLPIFQMKITLENIEPPIWRQIQTHNCTLLELHEIIQSSMGWDDDHMYAFEIGKKQYTDLDRAGDTFDFGDASSVRLSKLVDQGIHRFVYEYDFGDSWRHVIEIETSLPAEEGVRYPRCLDGRRACPPEDCGGPYGYPDLLDAIQDPDRKDHEERLEWIGEFDSEDFRMDRTNAELLHIRKWLGSDPAPHSQPPRFAEEDRIRARAGTVHPQYPDIPLGGWTGVVTHVARLIPNSYAIRWSDETLANVHPVYLKRCRRDVLEPEMGWLDEGELELASADPPMEMEQPANLATRPLSADAQEDRIRMAFGLTSDDPLPETDDAAQRQYLDYLKGHLAFPFDADFLYNTSKYSLADKSVSVMGFAESPIDAEHGILCNVSCEGAIEHAPLSRLQLEEENPNSQPVEDYGHWLREAQDLTDLADDDGEPYIHGDFDDELDEDEDEFWDDEEHDDEDFGPRLANGLDDEGPVQQPIRRTQPSVGRNDPCPCGSGKKFKKCCLKKQGIDPAE